MSEAKKINVRLLQPRHHLRFLAGRDGDDGSIREQEAFTILFEEGADVLAVDQVGLVGAQEAMVGEQVLEVAQGFGDQQFGAIAEVYIGVGVFGLATENLIGVHKINPLNGG